METASESRRTALRRGGTLAAVLLALLCIFPADWRAAGSFANDTQGYLQYDGIRQPAFGLWANGLHAVTGSWAAVGLCQLALMAAALSWFLGVVWRSSPFGPLLATGAAASVFMLVKLGMGSQLVFLGSEGLFIPMIVALAAAALQCVRAQRPAAASLACVFLMVMLSQVRPVAIPMLALVPAAMLVCWRTSRPGDASRRWVIAAAFVFGLLVLLLPAAFGKRPLQVGTTGGSLGFALLPRVNQLPVAGLPPDAPELWKVMAGSWQRAAQNLDCTEAALFDGQIQEAVRFDIGPRILFARPAGVPPFDWTAEADRAAATSLALHWIGQQPWDYARWSACHLWATLTLATFASQPERDRVLQAIHEVDPLVWRWAPLRTDYPNNHFEKPLTPLAQGAYWIVRAVGYATVLGGIVSLALLFRCVMRRTRPHPCVGVAAFGFAWVALHDVSVGLTVFPEHRFVTITLLGYVLFVTAALAAMPRRDAGSHWSAQ